MVDLVTENPQLAAYLMMGLLSIMGLIMSALAWFAAQTLLKIDHNQTKLFDLFRELAVEVAILKGRMERGGDCG